MCTVSVSCSSQVMCGSLSSLDSPVWMKESELLSLIGQLRPGMLTCSISHDSQSSKHTSVNPSYSLHFKPKIKALGWTAILFSFPQNTAPTLMGHTCTRTTVHMLLKMKPICTAAEPGVRTDAVPTENSAVPSVPTTETWLCSEHSGRQRETAAETSESEMVMLISIFSLTLSHVQGPHSPFYSKAC